MGRGHGTVSGRELTKVHHIVHTPCPLNQDLTLLRQVDSNELDGECRTHARPSGMARLCSHALGAATSRLAQVNEQQ